MEACVIRILLFLCFCMALPVTVLADPAIKVLSFNIWGGGLHHGKQLGETIAVIRATAADIIGLQEVHRLGDGCVTESCADNTVSLTQEIGRALGFHWHEQSSPGLHGLNAVLSRFPITGATAGGLGVRIAVGGQDITLFNLHLNDAPYQPYQLMRIAYEDAPFLTNANEAVAAASAARGRVIDLMESELGTLTDSPVIITGDFNEPSFRDWTSRAAALRRHPIPVAWPTTRRIEGLGFIDAYRAVFPDEITHPGETWTVLPGAKEHHDRIDFIFARGPGLSVESAAVVGEKVPEADAVVTPWPSDHRAMLAVLRLGALPPERTAESRVSRDEIKR
jgi:exodeoxyribonuclease III